MFSRVHKSRDGVRNHSSGDESPLAHGDAGAIGTQGALIDACYLAIVRNRSGLEFFWGLQSIWGRCGAGNVGRGCSRGAAACAMVLRRCRRLLG